MKRTYIALTVIIAGAGLGASSWWLLRSSRVRRAPAPPGLTRYVATPPPWHAADVKRATPPKSGLATGEKAARLDKIRRDYDELRTKVMADYTATGGTSPGALKAFLRQLALLEAEKRKDLLTLLTPAELEEIEMRETHAGDRVRQALGDTAATDAQRRAVFRLQRDFDDQFGYTFDLSPGFLLAREKARQALEDQVRAVLGDALMPAWLSGEGSEFSTFSTFAAQHGLPASVPLGLWRLRNEFVVGRLELNATPGLSEEQFKAAQTALVRRIELQARTLLGPALVDPKSQEVLAWLPRP